jgi:hypothetical protein
MQADGEGIESMSLWQTISEVQPSLPGWCIAQKAEALAAIVIAIRPEVSLEIGIYGGSSFIPIALAHKEIGFGICYGIDPWEPRASMRDETQENAEWWGNQDYPKLYSDFMTKIKELGLENCTRIIRDISDNVTPPGIIDLLHIDGNHSEQSICDVSRFVPNVRVGGICVMDDLDWATGKVRLAEQRLLTMGFKKLYPLGTGGVYQRIKQ